MTPTYLKIPIAPCPDDHTLCGRLDEHDQLVGCAYAIHDGGGVCLCRLLALVEGYDIYCLELRDRDILRRPECLAAEIKEKP